MRSQINEKNSILPWVLLAALIYLLAFVWRSSFLLADGNRYFCLFDDAMVSMRYALNFLSGKGLVWNSQEFVEGYTNLLQVMLMSVSLFVFGKSGAIVGMHLLGVVTVLLVALITRLVLLEVTATAASHISVRALRNLELLVVIGTIAYYPLVFWTVMGMETGLNTLLLLFVCLSCLRYRKNEDNKHLYIAGGCAGLAYITRPDSIVLSALLFSMIVFTAPRKTSNLNSKIKGFYRLKLLGPFGVPLTLMVVLQLAFRYHYYGIWMPNTYTLKMGNYPIWDRLTNGSLFVLPYLMEHLPLLLLAVYGGRALGTYTFFPLMAVAIGQIIFQVYVGGDAWSYWRMLVPSFPILLIFSGFGAYSLSLRLKKANCHFLVIALALVAANLHCLPHQFLFSVPRSVQLNQMDVEIGLTLRKILKPHAKIAVAMAGAIPYFSELDAIDILGKADPHIAKMKPDLSGSIGWTHMKSVPGHNKYDLNYSIKELKPDYIQQFSYGKQNLKDYVNDEYDCYWIGQWTYFLKKNSSEVEKESVKNYSAALSARREPTLCKAEAP